MVGRDAFSTRPVKWALRVLSIVPDIYSLELIGSGSVSIMAKPVAGEWIDDEFSGISKYGINQIISLLERTEAYEVGLKDEEIYSEKHQIEFVSYPIPDRGLPQSINDFSKFTKGLYHSAAGGNNIVIHCRAGIGLVYFCTAASPQSKLSNTSPKKGAYRFPTRQSKRTG